MKQRLNIMCKMLLLLVATAHFTGCVAIVAGVGGAAIGGTAYAMGDLAVLVDASPEHLERAIKQGGARYGFAVYTWIGRCAFRELPISGYE